MTAHLVDAVIGLILVLAFILNYIPQHYECFRLRSSCGLSSDFLVFSSLCMTFGLFQILLEDMPTLVACRGILACMDMANPTAQNLLCVLLGPPSWWFWFFRFPPGLEQSAGKERERNRSTVATARAMHRRQFAAVVVVSGIGAGLTAWALLDSRGWAHTHAAHFSQLFGGLGAFMNCIMWFPQVLLTYRLRRKGCLSLTMLCISVLGDIVWSGYLIVDGQTIWTWITNVPDVFLQLVLIAMICRFEAEAKTAAALDISRRRSGEAEVGEAGGGFSRVRSPSLRSVMVHVVDPAAVPVLGVVDSSSSSSSSGSGQQQQQQQQLESSAGRRSLAAASRRDLKEPLLRWDRSTSS